nr:reverse transcriptase family protein [Nitrosopumilus sp.]
MGGINGKSQNYPTSKIDIINNIREKTPKVINIYGKNKEIEKIELTNQKIIPMCLELYEKLSAIPDVPKKISDKKKYSSTIKSFKKKFVVMPKFTIEELNKSLLETVETPIIKTELTIYPVFPPMGPMIHTPISIQEFIDAFKQIDNKRDILGINKKIMDCLSEYLRARFVKVYNETINDIQLTKESSIARGFFVYKESKKGKTDQISSFRPVMEIPNIINHIHRILNVRISNHFLSNNYIDTNIQKGCISNQKNSIFEQIYKVKSVIKHANKHKKSCVILFLDISNAFGNLCLDKLYKILELHYLTPEIINYIRAFYEGLEYYFSIPGNKTTDIQRWKEGLTQGSSLSPLLFVIALNYVLSNLDKNNKNEHGYQIKGTKILLTAYVDDICIICKDIASAEKVLGQFIEKSLELGLPISKEKSMAMVINGDLGVKDIGGLAIVNEYKYLGETINNQASNTVYFDIFFKSVYRRLKIIENKKCDEETKKIMISKMIIPSLKRRLLLMYDLSIGQKKKISSSVTPFLEKFELSCELFADVTEIIKSSKDIVIQKIGIDKSINK